MQRKEDNPLWDIADLLTHGIFLVIFKIGRLVWRGMVFTGTWPLFLLVIIFGNSSEGMRNALGMPIFLSMLFAIFMTCKHLYSIYDVKRKLERARQNYRGVFFGLLGGNKIRLPIGKKS